YTNQTNSYTIASLSASAAYTVKVKNANNCESNTVRGNITVNYLGTNGQSAHATCGCATGTTDCSGTCKTTGNYTTEDGACTQECDYAYIQQRNQCGDVINPTYSTYKKTTCSKDCKRCETCVPLCASINRPYAWSSQSLCSCFTSYCHNYIHTNTMTWYNWNGSTWARAGSMTNNTQSICGDNYCANK
ncbi:MAG: hypothetical protein LBD87_06785, partial [Prevotellaceae bacterium]|nr:hypothetical protein [Prevotellaceae bacterium]